MNVKLLIGRVLKLYMYNIMWELSAHIMDVGPLIMGVVKTGNNQDAMFPLRWNKKHHTCGVFDVNIEI